MHLSSSQIILLKWFAIYTMFIDHFNHIFFDSRYLLLTTIGRFAFPIFAYLLVYNYLFNSKNQEKVLLRLGVFALFSQPFFYISFGYPFFYLNIFFDLWAGLVLVHILREKYQNIKFLLIIIIFILLPFYNYSYRGIVFIIATYLYLEQPNQLKLIIFIVTAFMINGSTHIIYNIFSLFTIGVIYLTSQTTIFFSYNKNHSLWFYFFYPLHIIIIKILTIYYYTLF